MNNEPKDKNALEWYQMGLQHGRQQGPATSRWLREETHGKERFYCECCKRECKYDSHTGWDTTSYCPDCGSKMQ